MSCNKALLGSYIEQIDRRNSLLEYGVEDVMGITNTKVLMETKARPEYADLSKFYILEPGEFIYNPRTSRNGEKVGMAYNDTNHNILFTFNNIPFRIKPERRDYLDPDYLYLFFLNPEFDRYARYNSWGSATELFPWEEMCRISIPVPPISEQRKIVHDYQVITNRIELLRKMNENLEEQEDTIFWDFYSDDSWDEGHFSDLVVGNIPGDWGSDQPEGNTNAQVTCIRGADIPGLSVGNTGDAPIRFILQKNFISKALPTNAMVIEISGGSPTQSTGRIALLTDILRSKLNQRVICSNFCKAVTVKEDYLYFFYLAWRHLYKTNRLFDYENSTIGLKNFDYQSFVTQESIKIPTIDGGKRLNALIEPIRKMIVFNGLEIERLLNLQATVLPNLMK